MYAKERRTQSCSGHSTTPRMDGHNSSNGSSGVRLAQIPIYIDASLSVKLIWDKHRHIGNQAKAVHKTVEGKAEAICSLCKRRFPTTLNQGLPRMVAPRDTKVIHTTSTRRHKNNK